MKRLPKFFLATFLLAVTFASWLAEKWSREGMMLVFFFGIGISAVGTALAQSPLQMAFGLFAIGVLSTILSEFLWSFRGMRRPVCGSR
jgi:hypothetical protein